MSFRQDLIRSLRASGVKPRIVVSNRESAADWLIRVGPLAKRLNEESKLDLEGDSDARD